MKKLVLALLVALASTSAARASIVCVAPTSSTAGSVTVTGPSLSRSAFNLDEWVSSDGTGNTNPLTPNLAYSLNGTAGSNAANLIDNQTDTFGAVTPNDGYFFLTGSRPTVAVGNTLTLLAGTYTIAAVSGFNPQCTQTFNGNLFVTGAAGERLSANVSAVPEPSTWAMLGVGAVCAGVVALRRRRATA